MKLLHLNTPTYRFTLHVYPLPVPKLLEAAPLTSSSPSSFFCPFCTFASRSDYVQCLALNT